MEIMEAYRRTLAAAEELRISGIEIKVKPSRSSSRRTGDPLPRAKWVVITFRPKNREQANEIKVKADELGWLGIVFDTSGAAGRRDWEIDWSFKVRDAPDGEWQARREEVEDLIEGAGEGPCAKG